ncbi:ABC transporter permease [Pelagovum pacificum]|uniref:ABC transporter permease n=1 Tax=Pelagovum pacificum TaxID=2588711 RepID=A0A5C5GBT4_9RHOB|nr:ABC transporter permease [Pelagovum pacificum]QQA42474.1 ABC transporter permease [Pelagovum pacificum]TNY31557.1 ABC transporter permease [Pelagovum pacificum]
MTWNYVGRRVAMFFAVVLLAASANFLIPRFAPGDPTAAVLEQLMSRGQQVEGAGDIVQEYRERFGLDDPLHIQYFRYLWNTLRFDLGQSISFFPQTVSSAILDALPWTIGLLLVSTFIAFGVGSLVGALIAWPGAPRAVKALVPGLMMLSAIPYYLLALIILYALAFSSGIFPLGGAYSSYPRSFDFETVVDILYHACLPALSIVLAGVGFWALGMRGAMIGTLGEDYLTLAEAKGLKPRRIFFGYAVRNAMLPQVTSLAIALGTAASGSVLVEVAFNYPGIGFLLYNALRSSDYFLVQGIAFVLVLTVAIAVLILDLVYPFLDPRIERQ